MSSQRRLDLERFQKCRETSRSPVPSSKVTKKVLTFQELQAANATAHKSRRRSTTPKAQLSAAVNSPLTQRIRHQILQSDQGAKTTGSCGSLLDSKSKAACDSGSLERRKRMERKKHRIGNSFVSPRLASPQSDDLNTPVEADSAKTSFFTPSPTTFQKPTSTAPRSLTASRASKLQAGVNSTVNESSSGRPTLTTPAEADSAKTSFFTPSPTTFQKPTSTTPRSLTAPRASKLQAGVNSSVNKSFSGRPTLTRSASSVSSRARPSWTKSNRSLTPPLVPSKRNSIRKQHTTLTPRSSTRRTPLSAVSNTPPTKDDDAVSTRRNLDKRTARLRFSGEFSAQIAKYNNESPSLFSPPPVSKAMSSPSVHLYVRKRPIFPHETKRGDFDVVSIDEASVIVYRTQMAADMKTKLIQPVIFSGITAAFDSDVDSHQVYEQAVAHLVETVVKQAKAATLLMFGQTGSGKTFTISACQERMAQQIFSTKTTRAVQVQSIELSGKTCRDLMNENEEPTPVKIVEQDDGSVHFINAASVTVTCAEEMNLLLANAKERRATQSTLQNDESSRSHAIYQIRLRNGGVLTLVDCAGTERRNDSIYHCQERQAESREINASLYALKECIRARRQSLHVPYRSNLLTRVLRECLESDEAPLAVIATVAPNATDTEHTVETLKTISKLTNSTFTESDAQIVESSAIVSDVPKLPKQWDHSELLEWMSRKRLLPANATIAAHLNGRTVMKMSKLQLRSVFYQEDPDLERAECLFRNLRAEADRVARLDLKRRFAQSKATKAAAMVTV